MESYGNMTPSDQYLSGLKLFTLLGSLTLVTFLVCLDTSIMGTAIPRITSEFHSLPDVGWYIGAFTLASATLQPLSGKLYTHFNTKIVFLTFVSLFELGSLLCGVASSSAVLIAGRVVAGLGASGIVNGAMTILAGAVPVEKSPVYTGIVLGTAQMGIVAGPLIGGALTEHAIWRWCFYMNLPIGGVAAALIAFVPIPERTKKPRITLSLVRKIIPDLDLLGFALFVPPSVMLLLALQLGSGGKYAWNSSIIIGLFCGAGVCAILFILWERRMGDQAMLPGKLLAQRVVWTSCVYASCIITCMMTASVWMPTYFQAVKGNGPTDSGVHILPSILSQLLVVIASGAAVTRTGYYLPWALVGGIITAIGNGLVSTFTASTSTSIWIGYQILLGAGRGCGMQMAIIAVQNAVLPVQYPVALASVVFFQNLSTSIAVVIANTIFAQTLRSAVTRYAPTISPQAALDAGSSAGAVRALVPPEQLDGVLRAYSESLRDVFYFLVGIACLASLASLGMGWKDIRNKRSKADTDVEMDEKREAANK
ncbi:efflux pump protein [Alternaria rosae]|uniref:efflux pump protein n=1 Tax=Alternaria rosae TaxID=1187941 RepID=UPI001E8DA588|nr:efflux pump protein [Alternaria rosae]KAH6882235.1 efflux pump protein [Alternaria rosae]